MLTGMLLLGGRSFGQITISGAITDKHGNSPLPGANITLENAMGSAVSDELGHFVLPRLKHGKYTVDVSYVGFKTVRRELLLVRDTILQVEMEGAAVLGDEVNIIATRAHDKNPVAFMSISNKELQTANLGKDIPYLIQGSPSTIVPRWSSPPMQGMALVIRASASAAPT